MLRQLGEVWHKQERRVIGHMETGIATGAVVHIPMEQLEASADFIAPLVGQVIATQMLEVGKIQVFLMREGATSCPQIKLTHGS